MLKISVLLDRSSIGCLTFFKMPTEEFLARLVKSKASGASVVVVAPEERGPEADSKAVPVADPDDVSDPMHIAVREEIRFLRYENLDLEKKSDALTKDNNASADRVFSLLTEKSELITECGSLSVKVADLENEVRGLEAALSASKDGLVEKKS
ncbi:uncharacterized protein LOC141708380 isoform X1 [Apium graveolens]|uniref:uncharacterized protein LOC141708380 isoform X1 n=2 Tax=Apium graveolens TaxID=4045 RepID=UPI003D79DD51